MPGGRCSKGLPIFRCASACTEIDRNTRKTPHACFHILIATCGSLSNIPAEDAMEDTIRHLHEMGADGILTRHDNRSVPPHVCYSISPYGTTLAPVLEKICDWAPKHQA